MYSKMCIRDRARGYVGELRDFLLCAAGRKEEPESGFSLAYDTVRIIYGAYRSAREGRRIELKKHGPEGTD